MTKNEVYKVILWATEPLADGGIRFRQALGSQDFLLMDPELSKNVINKKVFYKVEDIITIYNDEHTNT